MKLYFVRHGESEANVLRIISNRDLPHGLTPKGREQAATVASQLKDANISEIFSSPILRAVQTTEIISHALDLSYTLTDALREYDCGVLEGRADRDAWRQHCDIAAEWIQNNNRRLKPEQGESFLDIENRFLPYIEQIIRERRHAGSNLLFVGHGGTFRMMLPLLFTNIDREFVIDHSIQHTTCIIAEQKTDGFHCLQWGDLQLNIA